MVDGGGTCFKIYKMVYNSANDNEKAKIGHELIRPVIPGERSCRNTLPSPTPLHTASLRIGTGPAASGFLAAQRHLASVVPGLLRDSQLWVYAITPVLRDSGCQTLEKSPKVFDPNRMLYLNPLKRALGVLCRFLSPWLHLYAVLM